MSASVRQRARPRRWSTSASVRRRAAEYVRFGEAVSETAAGAVGSRKSGPEQIQQKILETTLTVKLPPKEDLL